MVGTVGGLLVSFLLAWGTHDRVWTPTFKGERHVRFERAVRYYDERMGLKPVTVLIAKQGRVVSGSERCAWAWRDGGWADDVIGFSTQKNCRRLKPELLALHEQCHRRMAHLEPAFWNLDAKTKEREVKECMIAYSDKARR